MARSPLMPCLWGHTEHSKQAQAYGSRCRRRHWITVRSPGRMLSDRDPSLTTCLLASALGTAWGNPSPAPARHGTNSPSTLRCVTTLHWGCWVYSLEHWDQSAPFWYLLLRQLHLTSVQNNACNNCLLWLESAYPLSHPFKTLVFSKGKENILCYLEFSMVTLCPRWLVPPGELSALCNISVTLLLVSTEVGRYMERQINERRAWDFYQRAELEWVKDEDNCSGQF